MDVREQIKKIIEAEDVISISGVARSCGLSISAVSSYLSGNYQGRNDRVEEALKTFIRRHKERQRTQVDIEYVDTSVAKKIHEIADMVHTDCEVGVIAGEAGLGKTFALRRYAEMNPDVIFIEVDCGYSALWLFKEICREMGLAQHGRVSSMTSEIIGVLRGSKRLLIVDEAEYLPYRALELLRRVHDKADIGLLLAGLPRLIHNLRGSRGQYAQLYSRVGVYARLEKLSPVDTKALVESADTKANGTYKDFHRASKGNTRVLSKLLRRCVRVAKLNGTEIDKRLIEETAQTLIL